MQIYFKIEGKIKTLLSNQTLKRIPWQQTCSSINIRETLQAEGIRY